MTLRRASLVPAAIVLVLAAILVYFPPDRYAFYPQCPIYTWTHLRCPGCGSTRALASLLRGHLDEAIHDNALTVASIPFLLAYALVCFRSTRPIQVPRLPPWILAACLTVTTVFTLARNLHR